MHTVNVCSFRNQQHIVICIEKWTHWLNQLLSRMLCRLEIATHIFFANRFFLQPNKLRKCRDRIISICHLCTFYSLSLSLRRTKLLHSHTISNSNRLTRVCIGRCASEILYLGRHNADTSSDTEQRPAVFIKLAFAYAERANRIENATVVKF